MGGGDGGRLFKISADRRGAYLKFLPIGGALIRRGRFFEGDANSKSYGMYFKRTGKFY